MTADYASFVHGKSDVTRFPGMDVQGLHPALFGYQADLTRWALRRGRAAVFADTGLGKTWIAAEWARHVATLGRVLILAPLAVAEQTVREAARIDVDVRYLRDDDPARPIVITNYDLLHRFDPSVFSGIILDESSILKSFNGATRNALIEAFSATPYRLACTATPAPNDYTELGNHSEFLGVLSRVEMLAEYFVHDGGSTQDWRLKGHAVDPFWRWVAQWGAVVKRPSDLGYSDDGFALPPLRMHDHPIRQAAEEAWAAGQLFAAEATTLNMQRALRRVTTGGRVSKAAELATADSEPCLIWCELNAEADAVTAAIPGAVQVAGNDTPEDKAARMLGFAAGEIRVLVSKPSICGFGMNFQRCSRQIFMGASHSYEMTYQAIRRCWRFGQTRPVDIHVIRSEGEQAIVANFRRKEADAERLAEEMIARVRESMRESIGATGRQYNTYDPKVAIRIPAWAGEETA